MLKGTNKLQLPQKSLKKTRPQNENFHLKLPFNLPQRHVKDRWFTLIWFPNVHQKGTFLNNHWTNIPVFYGKKLNLITIRIPTILRQFISIETALPDGSSVELISRKPKLCGNVKLLREKYSLPKSLKLYTIVMTPLKILLSIWILFSCIDKRFDLPSRATTVVSKAKKRLGHWWKVGTLIKKITVRWRHLCIEI